MSSPQIFADLPQELKDKICLYSGHFKLRYDNKTKKLILVAQLNLELKEWVEFKDRLFRKAKHYHFFVTSCFLFRSHYGFNYVL
jgi:hypothetical protein